MENKELLEMVRSKAQSWLTKSYDAETRAQVQALLDNEDPTELIESFYKDLEFGTGGLRGIMGVGTNRMNVYTVGAATQGLSNYLKKNFAGEQIRVAIGHDSRNNSRMFAEHVADIFASNGFTVFLFDTLRPTPELSFAIRELKCHSGVVVTASHNPKEYNGYKVYGSDGCQMTPEAAKRVVALLEHMDYFTSAKTTDFDAALAAGSIRYIPDEVLDAFVDAVYAQRVGSGEGIENLKLVYTPLNGAGLECVKKLTQKIGIRNMTIVKEQEQPDGHFPTCPYPNPEIRQAMELGLQYCDRVHPDILIGTDPDCDRCGTAVPDGKGGYRLISGNEMGVILLDFICRSRIANGTMPENPVAVTTIVSTDMVTAVAKKYGVELRRVLTGFKYIGEQIALLEQGGHPERYIFGFEESFEYLSGTHARDKDAVNAVLLICEAAAWYAKKGMTLGDAIDALFDANRFGQKNGLGFWRYKEDSKGKPKKEEDAAVDDLLAEVSQPKRDFSEEEIIARMMIPMVNEVVRCLEEGIIATPAEADMALVYGLGFPPFHGGAFRWLDTLGSAKYLDMAQQYQRLGPLYEVPEGLRNKARHNEPYYPPVEPARPVGDLKTA